MSAEPPPVDDKPVLECRAGCGACCIALSISSPIPGMAQGKAAGVRCVQLTDDNLCRLFGLPERPDVCSRLRPSAEMCGDSRAHALHYLAWLEAETAPDAGRVTSDECRVSTAQIVGTRERGTRAAPIDQTLSAIVEAVSYRRLFALE